MARLATIAPRLLRLPLFPSPKPLFHSISPLLSSFSRFSSSSSSSFPSLSHPIRPFDSHIHETSDFESDSDEPISSSSDSDLPAFLRLLSHAKSLSSCQKEALASLRRSFSVEPTKDLVCRALWELRWDWESSLLAFRWGEDCILECPRAWHLMIWMLGKQGRFDLAWFLVKRMYKESVLTQRAIVIMIERYAAANEACKAIKTFRAMEKFKINADLTAFHALLHVLCKNKNVEEAEELLLINRKFFPLTAEGFNIVLNGWCNVMTDVIEAKRVWREMSSYCITPDATSYAHMIRCFSKGGNLFDSLRLYDEMKKRGWIPGLAVFNSLVYVLTKENCLKDAQNVFARILDAGLQPDAETYNCMIHPLCEGNKLEEARRVMQDMRMKSIKPTLETFHAFLKVEDIDETLNLLRTMRDVGCGPNRYTFLLLFDKYFGLSESENALRMWGEMRRYYIDPDSAHYLALVQGLVKHEWTAKALEFYNVMKDKGFPPDPKLEKLFKSFIAENKDHWGRISKEYSISQRGKRDIGRGVDAYLSSKKLKAICIP
ncbi:pentatricopeptide repeat-containing protein At1g80880, mitochondrial [Typha latifolia]|uniref:pentatricopeptide repeat-containing protein At1g80880, mitochondrial n=1 Tax=Typha latifolia TaxID=4733 RepID=UPI003C2C307D